MTPQTQGFCPFFSISLALIISYFSRFLLIFLFFSFIQQTLNSETINNIFTRKKKYKIQYLHIAVFPLNNETVVITFQEKNNNRYQVFERFLKETTLEKRMEIINRILFLYTEDYYLSNQLDADIIKSLEESAQTIQDTFTISPKRSLINAIKDYDLRRDTCIPNLLSKGYAVNKVE